MTFRGFIANIIMACITDRPSITITSQLNWPVRSITIVKCHPLMWFNSLWLWRWLPHTLPKCQSLSRTVVTTHLDNHIPLMKLLLVSNLSQNVLIVRYRYIWHKYQLQYFKIVSNLTRLTAREISYNNFEISLVVFMSNITTNHAITYTHTTTWEISAIWLALSSGVSV